MWIGHSLSGQKLPWDRKAHEDDGGQCNHRVWNPPAGLNETKFYTRITLLTSAHDSAVGKANQISEGRPHKGPELQSLPRMARSLRVAVKIS